jgi:hypothetical protein
MANALALALRFIAAKTPTSLLVESPADWEEKVKSLTICPGGFDYLE